ncbi:MAG: hypothetical protein GY758_09525 [Fuerstiella sp.]|jgi:hypothetical protein|nr:hypothetical protein [Fuerstiella sp.]MCP4506426.1 hypothetical protein [Fuerstiella sp.]
MKTIEFYEDLPDSITQDELCHEFSEVLAADVESDPELASEALFALSERQWNTYELADEQLRTDVAAMTLKLWDDQDADRAETLLGVTSRMGLGVVLQHLRKKDRSSYSAEVRKSVEDAINEFGDSVDDPFSGMED